jgi:hypothetical protein
MDAEKFQVVKEALPELLPLAKGGLPSSSPFESKLEKQEQVVNEVERIDDGSQISSDYVNTNSSVALSETDSSFSEDEHEVFPMNEQTDQKDADELVVVSSAGKNHTWGMSRRGDLYHCTIGEIGMEWVKLEGGILFSDFSVAKGGFLFAIGLGSGLLYRVLPDKKRIELTMEEPSMRVRTVSAVSYDSAYCLTEENTLVHFDHGKFTLMAGLLKKISVGGPHKKGLFGSNKFELWAIDMDDYAVRYLPSSNTWERYPIKLQDIAAGKDLVVYGIRLDDLKLVKLDREKNQFFEQPMRNRINCAPISVHLKNLSVYKENRDLFAVEANSGSIIKIIN